MKGITLLESIVYNWKIILIYCVRPEYRTKGVYKENQVILILGLGVRRGT